MVRRLDSRRFFWCIRMVLLLLRPTSTANHRHCSNESECPVRSIRPAGKRATSIRATSIRATSIRPAGRCSRPLRSGTRSLSGQRLRPFCHVDVQNNATLETIAAVSAFSYSLSQVWYIFLIFHTLLCNCFFNSSIINLYSLHLPVKILSQYEQPDAFPSKIVVACVQRLFTFHFGIE